MFLHTARVAPEKTIYSARLAVMFSAESFGENKMKLTFTEQYKHPSWQKRRLEMLEYHGWECEGCQNKDKTLHVHHKQYFKGRMLWEYSNDELQVLCETCHEDVHHVLDGIKEMLTNINIDEAFSLLAGYFGRYGDINTSIIEKAMQVDGLAFAHGFVASLSQNSISEIEKTGEFVTRNNSITREIFLESSQVFGREK